MSSKRLGEKLYLYNQRLSELHTNWKPTPKQEELIQAIFGDGYKRIFIRGGRKSAKTESALYVSNRITGTGNSKVASIIGPSLKQQRKIIWNNRRLQWFAPKEWGSIIREAESMIRFPNGSFIEVDGSENSDAHRGEEQDLLWLDEFKDHEQDSYEAMYPNLAARDGILVVGGTPPRVKKSLYYELEQEALSDPRWKVFHWRCWDNPEVSRKWLEEEKKAYYRRGDGYLWEVEYEANYKFGGKDAVFSVFDPGKHVIPHDVLLAQIEKDRRKLDYFIITDPGNRVCHATLFIAYDRTNNFVWILDELYETTQANTATCKIFPRIMEKAKELFPKDIIPFYVYDEAALWYMTEVMAQFPDAPPLSPTNKAIKDKETSMGTIKGCMADSHYFQSERCCCLKEEFLSYYTDDQGRYPKVDDDAIDCLRYFYDYVGYSYELQVKDDTELERIDVSLKMTRNGLTEDPFGGGEDILWN